MADTPPEASFVSPSRELRFCGFRGQVVAEATGDVLPALLAVEAAVGKGLYAAGYVAYEAAPGLAPELAVREPAQDLPLVWFGLYSGVEENSVTAPVVEPYSVGPWQPQANKDSYQAAVERVRAYLAAGDSYQVNFTFGLTAPFRGSGRAWFDALCRAQQADYCAYLDLGRFKILSASPELFFRLDDDLLQTRPMKGTRRRSPDPAEDARLRDELMCSPKDRAENVMIVDLLRNDMGRISTTGSVEVTDLFKVEAYPTVWQMTSSIRSRTSASMTDVFRALFPCGSVTGAPKRRTMEIIRELESGARGVYCGAVGWWKPGRRGEFNVAIRTVTLDSERETARYGVGSGVTWDSTHSGEYEECLLKSSVLEIAGHGFELLETLLFDGAYFLLERHIERLKVTADFFGFSLDLPTVRQTLTDAVAGTEGPCRVRLTVSRSGRLNVECHPVLPAGRLRVTLAALPVDEDNVFLQHKTTWRDVYEKALAQVRAVDPTLDDVILWNSRREITETCLGNIVADLGGRLVTPPIRCGLLAGTMRAELLEKGQIVEQVLSRADLVLAQALYLVNSVRKWVPLDLR